MSRSRRLLFAGLLAFAVFCVVQDLATIAGARRYVRLQRAALAARAVDAAGGSTVTVDDVMVPAVASSVRQGLLYGGATAVIGVALALRAGRRQS